VLTQRFFNVLKGYGPKLYIWHLSELRNFVTMLICLLVVLMVLWDMIYIAPKMRSYRVRQGEL
jgi:hypothetical protein